MSKNRKSRVVIVAVAILGVAIAATVFFFAPASSEKNRSLSGSAKMADASLRRLTDTQYRQIILDVLGPTIRVNGVVEPGVREAGLIEVGSRRASVSASGMAQFHALAKDIAEQATSETNRNTIISCVPKAVDAWDAQCGEQFLSQVGRLLFRRSLGPAESQAIFAIAEKSATASKDFYKGVGEGLSSLLIAPQFLFRWEIPQVARDGTLSLDALSKASRLSFFLWNSGPDLLLLEAAESGALDTRSGLREQVDRMLESPRLEAGTRAFFIDMFQFDHFHELVKDAQIYPKFSAQVINDAEEQTLRTVVDHLLVRQLDYRDLFTTRRTFLTPVLGAIYRVPTPSDKSIGMDRRWISYEFDADDPRPGILMQTSFVTLHSHPGRSSPTLRGKALREIFLCQKVPDPPANVSFTEFNESQNSEVLRTTRKRLEAHATAPACAGCHRLTDPIGLAMEVADSDGSFRTEENGVAIDTTGNFEGTVFSDAAGLAEAIRNNPVLPSCLVNRVYSYGTGRAVTSADRSAQATLSDSFAKNGYKLRSLLREIALDDEFYRVPPTKSSNLMTVQAKATKQ